VGSWLCAVGDVNGDGHNDVLLGAQLYDGSAGVESGVARLFFGSDTGASASPVWTREGSGPNYLFGCFVGGAGDVNGDGFDDMLISERGFSDEGRPERGRVLIFHGGPNGPKATPDWEIRGPVAYALMGLYAAGIGDIDGDGFDDVAVSAWQYTHGAMKHTGLVEIYRGGRNGCETRPAWRTMGDKDDSHLGYPIAAGDFNGDHVPDLLTGAPYWGDSIPERGLLLTYLGRRH